MNSDEDHSNTELGYIAYTLSWGGQVAGADTQHINITSVEIKSFGDAPPFWAVTPHEDGPNLYRTRRLGLQALTERADKGQTDEFFNPQDLGAHLSFTDGGVINQEWGIVKYLGRYPGAEGWRSRRFRREYCTFGESGQCSHVRLAPTLSTHSGTIFSLE